MSSAWDGGSTRQWRRVRAAVLLRDAGMCRLQLPGCTGSATCVHHTRGKDITGDDPAYLIAACTHCNLKVGKPAPNPRPTGGTKW